MTDTEGNQKSNRWVFAPNGLPARLALAVLGSAGILYANFSPVIVSGLTQSQHFTAETAAYVFAANMYGTAIGGFAAVFLVGSLNWRWSSISFVMSYISFSVGSENLGLRPILSDLITLSSSPKRRARRS